MSHEEPVEPVVARPTKGRRAEARPAHADGSAPAAIWDAIASRIERPAPGYGSNRLPWPGTSAPPPSGRRNAHRAGILAGTASATVAVAVIAVLGVEVDHLRHRVSHLSADTDTSTLAAAARHALVDPRSRRITLTGTGSVQQSAAEVVALPSGAAFLFDTRLVALPPGHIYQLWAIVDRRTISIGLFGAGIAAVAFSLDTTPATDAFAVTVEPAGGRPAPTGPTIANTASWRGPL
jgi:anti-sigma-K factor RskA